LLNYHLCPLYNMTSKGGVANDVKILAKLVPTAEPAANYIICILNIHIAT